MRTNKLPRLVFVTLGALLTKKIIFKSFPKVQLWFGNKLPPDMEHKATASKTRYSRTSDKLWAESPQCVRTRMKFTYKSRYQNAYGEPVFYKSRQEPYRILPAITGSVPGFYNAYPGGLNIDQQTGEIDINDSDAGVRYTVEFTPLNSDCVVRTQVVISGIGYEGGIFSLSSPDDLILKPFYFGSTSPEEEVPSREVPSREAPSGEFGINPEPNQKPTADLLGLVLDPNSARIDLRKTIESGALGFRRNDDGTCDNFPENGTSKDFTIYYRLASGPGKGALNRTKIRIHFFDTEADMPDELKVRIRQQHNSVFRQSLPLSLLLGMSWTVVPDSSWDTLAALMAALSSFLFLMPKAKESNSPLVPPEVCLSR